MDFREYDELAEYRVAARAWADANIEPAWVEDQHRSGVHQTMALHHRFARDGLLGAGWPREYGGTDVDPRFSDAVFSEIARRGMGADGWSTTHMVIGTISHVGTEEQKQRYIGGALRGEIMIVLGYTEPDNGSDAAAAKTSAVRDGDEWIINGQKMFTSTAQCASHVFVLTRTNPSAPKHDGLTLFVVPTDAAGFEYRPIRTLGGQETTATFYSDVRVPDSARIGGVDDGWNVMRVALVFERGAGSPMAAAGRTAGDLLAWAHATDGVNGAAPIGDPIVAARIGRIATEEEVARLLIARTKFLVAKGELPGVEGSMQKLYNSEVAIRHFEAAVDILGREGIVQWGSADAPADGLFERGFRSSVVDTIRGGASEVLLDIIASRRLGLPRHRQR
ncbi:acyl-CoA dehydrogenase family protein [Nocardia macrotermitis]|uniref:Acyl-CoA dehydrogenase FadE26 n=1 Tax=Nocardia macrotermitis TaxID=2585198 RepID=A0A7K0DFA0_9NOCA|nr:acyl-CoA dehydrogenase family protein [Nocardia macrotermitis]MQY24329.1 Acyl-CoA dehydrogenase FadE26 [Nocardia macrotermitis]